MAKTMKNQELPKEKTMLERYPDNTKDPLQFSGVARSVQCFSNNGKFRDFKILTLTIEDGVVVDIKYSDPYCNFEAISRLELANEMSVIHLNNNWQDGKTLSK